MKPIKTSSSNHNFGPPRSVTDGSIGDLPCEITEEDGLRWVRSIWRPSDEEREAIAAGGNVELDVGWIGGFPPVSVNTTDVVAAE